MKVLTASLVLCPAMWGAIGPGNDRPMTMLPNATSDVLPVGSPAWPNGPASANLQDILNYIYKCNGCVNAKNDQQTASMWTPSTNPGILTPTLVVEYSANSWATEFGIWSGTDASNITMAPIFAGWAPGTVGSPLPFPTFANIAWNSTGDQVTVVSPFAPSPMASYNIGIGSFGFYIKTGGGQTWFSDDELNPGGSPQMLAYLGGNGTASAGAWTLAFEDSPFNAVGTDKDFNDFVVKIESMAAVPEPGTMLLLGTALVGVATLMRRRNRA